MKRIEAWMFTVALAGQLVGVAPAQDASPPQGLDNARPLQKMPFHIYLDNGSVRNHYIPSGFMGDYSDIVLNQNWKKGAASGESCIRVKYSARALQGEKWAGVYWQDPPNNWGTMKNGGYNLSSAKKLRFKARGEKGGETLEFAVGGIPGEFPDSFLAIGAPEILTAEWKEYEVDLEGHDLSICQGGFRFVVSREKHPDGAVFYLDDIRFE
jgi:hypothetical protein